MVKRVVVSGGERKPDYFLDTESVFAGKPLSSSNLVSRARRLTHAQELAPAA